MSNMYCRPTFSTMKTSMPGLTVALALWIAFSGHSHTWKIICMWSVSLGKTPSPLTLLHDIHQLTMTLWLQLAPCLLSAYFKKTLSRCWRNSSSSYAPDTTPSNTRKPLANFFCINRCSLQNTTSCVCGSTPLNSEILSSSFHSFSTPY